MNDVDSKSETTKSKSAWDVWALVFSMVFPSIVTLAYFVWGDALPPALKQSVYAVGKTIQFAFPVVWVVMVQRRRVRPQWPRRDGLLVGAGFGVVVMVAMLLLYHTYLKPSGFFDSAGEEIRDKIAGFGVGNLPGYIALGLFYSVAHSFLEEYYWRWYVFAELKRYMSVNAAVVVSSLGFMAHHVILLGTYFGWNRPEAYLFSFAVAFGGGVWAWLYHRSGSLYGPWLSHALIDAGIFLVGYDLARPLFTG